MSGVAIADVDVAVVGAGISGLTAARRLRRAGASVAVLEARDRVGGKMYTEEIAGCTVDLGAHWVGPRQHRMLALVRELDIATEKQHLEGRHVLTLGGKRHTFRGTTPVRPPLGAAETALRMAQVELRRRRVDLDAPWTAPDAARLDSQSLEDWMGRLRTRAARMTFEIVARTVFGAEPSELSMLFFLWYTQSAGGVRQLTEFEGGAQDSRLTGGAQQICERIAGELGDAVTLGTPVTSIRVAGDDAVVVRAGDRELTARRVVLALAPSLLEGIEFDPPLPPARAALVRRMPMGGYMKGVAVYERAWWRERGLSGVAFADEGPVQMVIDDSGPGGEPGVLVGFVTGAPAREVQRLDPDERRRAVLTALGRAVSDDAPEPTAYRELNWLDERWSRGAPVGLMGPGTVTELGPALREPVGPLHWAGTETATEWNGYMEGGVQAGERAADEVASRLEALA